MKQIINHIVVKNEFVKELNNLCFIDTPGFNPGQETDSDYDTATAAISTANAVIWCLDSKAGSIKSDEFDILFDVFQKNEKLGIYIVLNKADLNSDDENLLIIDEIENQLNIKGIPFKGITLYSSNYNEGYTFTNQPKTFNNYRGISLSEFLESYNVENKQKEKNLLATIDEVFVDYINADNQRIKKLENQIHTLKILEKSFSAIIDYKDEQISYYKARIDSKHYKKIKNFTDTANIDEDLYDSLADLKQEMTQTIEKDKSDIEKANELCRNMKKAVAEVFGHKLSNIDLIHTTNNINKRYYCNNCGSKLKENANFCNKCGKSCN